MLKILGISPIFRQNHTKRTCMGVINLMEFICSIYIYIICIYIYLWVEYLWGGWYWVITVCMIPGMNMKTSGLSWYLQSWGFVNLLYYRGFDKRVFSNVSPSGKSTIKMTRSNTKPMFLSYIIGEGLLQDKWLVVSWFLMKKHIWECWWSKMTFIYTSGWFETMHQPDNSSLPSTQNWSQWNS